MTPVVRRRRLTAALAAGIVAMAVSVTALAVAPDRSEAATAASILQSFNPADIISDAVMYNSSTMTTAQIQSFLNAEQPTCASGYTCLKTYKANTPTLDANLMCGKYTGASNESAASIISKVGKACKVNPQVILVTLQKEQSLITGVSLNAYPNAYRSATGLGCPDTAACDPAKYGFFNQVYGLGYWLIRYTTPPGTTGPGWTSFSWFPVGKTSAIPYNPSTSCGAKAVKIANKATASLYYYTPYVPNAAALAAGYGSGDSCSAYGNRNFFLYFTQWFGSTHLTVTGAIKTYWSAHSSLGNPTANAVASTANGGGTSQTFQNGTVYSSKAGTFTIKGALLSEYNRRGGVKGSLQWPTAEQGAVTANGGGLMQRFGSGEIYSSSVGTFAVRGDLRAAYLGLGGVTGSLGFPRDTAATLGTGWVQHFTKGTAYFTSGTGGFGVLGASDTGYSARKGPTGALGWPVGNATARTADGRTGTVQKFQNGDLYVSSAGTADVLGQLRSAFTASADRFDVLGWPVADATSTATAGGGTIQVFTAGRLYAATGKAAVAVTGPILTTYRARGEVASSLGWPVSTQAKVTAHGSTKTVQTFSNGAAYLTGSSVTTVTGGLYSEYRTVGGPTGSLGWVTGAAHSTTASGGGWTQTFASGTMYYSSRTGKAYPVTGSILKLYKARGQAASSLGWPAARAAKVTAHGVTKTTQAFANGGAYQTGTSVTTVTGSLYQEYLVEKGPTGSLGWVTAAAKQTTANGGGWTQTFKGGTLFYSSTTKQTHPLSGAMLTLYTKRGGVTGNLGWPGAAQTVTENGGGKFVVFTNGRMYSSKAGTAAIRGALLTAYLNAGGPAGKLGWPLKDATVKGAVSTQTFQHGTITYTSGKTTVHVK